MTTLKTLESEMKAGRISRREFIRATSMLGLAVATGGALSTAHAAPQRGGKFTVGMGHGSTTDTLDPAHYENDFEFASSFARYNFLTEIGTNGEVIPELAESWDVSRGGTQWTFRIRSGVEFHNGETVTPEHVVRSIQHHLGEDSTSAVKPLLKDITDIRVDGKNVVITLSAGNADFSFTMSDVHIPIMPLKDGAPDWQSGIGTGPYVMKDLEPGVRLQLSRNPNYWKAGRAHFDEIEMLTIADVVARTNALTTGQIHHMDRCDLKTLHLLKRDSGIQVEEVSGNGHYTIPMRTNIAPFDDNNIRLALKYALDREAMLDTVLRGHGYLGNDHPIGRGQRFFAKDLPQKAYDPDKAKFYLGRAGLSSLNVNLSAADAAFQGAVDSAVLFKEHAAKAGIEINVIREPNDGYWANVWNTDNRSWCMSFWQGRPTEDWMFSTAYEGGASWNESNWNNAEFNRLLVAARSELDENERRGMYEEMQRICSDEGGSIVPVFNNYVHAISKKVTHDTMGTNMANDGNRFMERWWFA